jgi:enoyl-CoA hydratase/carnithine racemase
MVRTLTAALLAWRDDPAIHGRGDPRHGQGRTGSAPFGAFCAGGDIRFFHQAALAGQPALEDFFTEEYALNHLIHTTPSPTSPSWTASSWAAAWESPGRASACAS